MPGIRVHHKTFHGGTFVIEAGKEYAQPWACPRCNPIMNGEIVPRLDGSIRIHYHKAHHIDLDGEGNGIISEGVLNAIREVDPHGLAGLEIVNEVKAPPPLSISMADIGKPEDIAGEYIGRNGHG